MGIKGISKMESESHDLLLYKSKLAREQIIKMAATETGCHIGGSLSVIDLLMNIYHSYHANFNNKIVLSKGHSAAALYATLFVNGLIEEDPSLSYGQHNSLYTGHPNHKIASIAFSTGSLGHGIPYTAGWSLSQKLRRDNGLGIVICGDGELQEGLCWETFQIIQSKCINNFICIVDCNGTQNDGYVEDISELINLRQRFEAFGFDVEDINGHNHLEIQMALNNKSKDKPLIILAKTVKGKGIVDIEGNPDSHYAKISERLKNKWLRSLK